MLAEDRVPFVVCWYFKKLNNSTSHYSLFNRQFSTHLPVLHTSGAPVSVEVLFAASVLFPFRGLDDEEPVDVVNLWQDTGSNRLWRLVAV